MNRIFDPIDIVFIALISLYFAILFLIIIMWYIKRLRYNENRYRIIKIEKPIRYKVIKITQLKKKIDKNNKAKMLSKKKAANTKNKNSNKNSENRKKFPNNKKANQRKKNKNKKKK